MLRGVNTKDTSTIIEIVYLCFYLFPRLFVEQVNYTNNIKRNLKLDRFDLRDTRCKYVANLCKYTS